MRTNFASLFLAVGMGLIVILLGFGALSAAGLVSFLPEEAFVTADNPANAQDSLARKEFYCQGSGPAASPYVPASPAEAAAIASGDALFKANCAQCHAVNEKVVGPALAGITKRRSISWLVPWVHNSAKVVASGDEYAVKLFNDNGKQQMPSFALSKKEIEDIIAYVTLQQGSAASAGVDNGMVVID